MTNEEILAKAMDFTKRLDSELNKNRLEMARIDLEANGKALNISKEEYSRQFRISSNHEMDFNTLAKSIETIIKILTKMSKNSGGAYPIYF